jgi:hypothetical protein
MSGEGLKECVTGSVPDGYLKALERRKECDVDVEVFQSRQSTQQTCGAQIDEGNARYEIVAVDEKSRVVACGALVPRLHRNKPVSLARSSRD